MGRRRSHPIKLRNLNAVTQRLCSSAGHLLEMEFEDLVIIADARRPKDSPIALLQENTIKNRYVNILPCNNRPFKNYCYNTVDDFIREFVYSFL